MHWLGVGEHTPPWVASSMPHGVLWTDGSPAPERPQSLSEQYTSSSRFQVTNISMCSAPLIICVCKSTLLTWPQRPPSCPDFCVYIHLSEKQIFLRNSWGRGGKGCQRPCPQWKLCIWYQKLQISKCSNWFNRWLKYIASLFFLLRTLNSTV